MPEIKNPAPNNINPDNPINPRLLAVFGRDATSTGAGSTAATAAGGASITAVSPLGLTASSGAAFRTSSGELFHSSPWLVG
jgi:hypothetical protein